MILILHLSIAFSSIMFAALTFAQPSRSNLRISYGLIAGTLATGVFLMAGSTTHLFEATVSGVLYLAFVTLATVTARRRSLVRN